MPNLLPSSRPPRPIRSQREIIAERLRNTAAQVAVTPPVSKEEKEKRAELARILKLPKKERKKARKIRYREVYNLTKRSQQVITEVYPFKSKEEYYAKYAYMSAMRAILANPEVPQEQKNLTAAWGKLVYYTRDAYVELIRATFELRDDLSTKEKKLWQAARHIS